MSLRQVSTGTVAAEAAVEMIVTYCEFRVEASTPMFWLR